MNDTHELFASLHELLMRHHELLLIRHELLIARAPIYYECHCSRFSISTV